MNNQLPELTEEERTAMNSLDMTVVLGTWEERCGVAMNAAKRYFRERNELEKQLAAYASLAPCGHSERFTDWEDHSQPIRCTLCEIAKLRERLAAAEARLAAVSTSEWDRITAERDEARMVALWLLTHGGYDIQEVCRKWPWLVDLQPPKIFSELDLPT